MALKTVALAIHDGDLAWSQTTDFSMFCALAEQDEKETRLRVFHSLERRRKLKRLRALRGEKE